MIVRVAVVSEQRLFRRRLAQNVASDGVLVATAPTADHLLRTSKAEAADVVVLKASGAGSAQTVLEAVLKLPARAQVIVIADTDAEAEAGLIAAGATTVLSHELDEPQLVEAIRAIVRRSAGSTGRRADELSTEETESRNPAMLDLLELTDRVARGDSSVLILGETGSGKEWLARRIHDRSPRASGPFVAVNCAAIPEGLAESELFGHVKGAFTGASRSRRGHFEVAHGGTLFLDEVGELSPGLQVRLLRALQDRSFQPVGSERPIEVDVRVMAATNQPLESAVEQGTFRKDLYYRLAVVTLRLPALRERREDITPLVEHYLRRFGQQLGGAAPTLSRAARLRLEAYDWPGNIRELINLTERAVLLGTGDSIEVGDLPDSLARDGRPEVVAEGTAEFLVGRSLSGAPYEVAFEAFERWYFGGLLEATNGRVTEAAERAGMSRRNLYNKIQRRGLRREDYRG